MLGDLTAILESCPEWKEEVVDPVFTEQSADSSAKRAQREVVTFFGVGAPKDEGKNESIDIPAPIGMLVSRSVVDGK